MTQRRKLYNKEMGQRCPVLEILFSMCQMLLVLRNSKKATSCENPVTTQTEKKVTTFSKLFIYLQPINFWMPNNEI